MKTINDIQELNYLFCSLARTHFGEDFEEKLRSCRSEELEKIRLSLCLEFLRRYYINLNDCRGKDSCLESEKEKCQKFEMVETDRMDFLHEALNITIPSHVQKLLPTYDPNSLIILAWSGTLVHNDNESNDKSIDLGNIKWVNKIFRNKLESENINDGRLKSFFIDRDNLSIRVFWDNYLKTEVNTWEPKEYLDCLVQLVTFVVGKQISSFEESNDLANAFSEQFVSQPLKSICKAVIKRVPFSGQDSNETFEIIAGFSLQNVEGIGLFQNKESYDAFTVFNIEPMGKNATIKKENVLSIQGVLIPVQSRHEVVERIKVEYAKGRALGLIARSYSHNIGSHPLGHIINELGKAEKNIDYSDLLEFLQYSKLRNNLIADITSSNYVYSLGLSVHRIFNPLSNNNLLKRYLCATENGLEVVFPIFEEKNDINCEIPFASTGCHAVYSILENFARNSAKHGSRREGNKFVSISIKHELSGSYYKLTLYDNSCDQENEISMNLPAASSGVSS
jgi:hypothetical protein